MTRQFSRCRIISHAILYVLFLLFLTMPTFPAFAEDSGGYVETIYSRENGLSCGEANDITETSDGILWIGTYAGLYRYNGKEFKLMRDFDSVRNVNCLYVDDADRLFIGTNDSGVSVSKQETVVDVMNEAEGLDANSVRAIVKSSDGNYYIGTSGNLQIFSFEEPEAGSGTAGAGTNDSAQKTSKTANDAAASEKSGGLKLLGTLTGINYAQSLSADRDGHVAAVTSEGTLYILSGSEILSTLEDSAEQEVFYTCTFTKDGTLYIGTSGNRILKGKIEDDRFVETGEIRCGGLLQINRIVPHDTLLYICADNGVGYIDENEHFSLFSTAQFNNSIDGMAVDYQEDLWFVSSRLGVLRLSPSKFNDLYLGAGLDERVVNSTTMWNGMLVVGTDSGLDMLYSDGSGAASNTLTNILHGVRVRCVQVDKDGYLWISTYGKGLVRADKNYYLTFFNRGYGEYGDRARVSVTLSDGAILSASDSGLDLIEDSRSASHISYGEKLGSAQVLCLIEAKDGTIYAGTDGDGIAVLNRSSGSMPSSAAQDASLEITRKIEQEDGLSSGVILRIVQSARTGGLYIVASNGLNYIAPDGSIRLLENFPYYNNFDVVQDGNGELFILSSAGIYVVNEDALLRGEAVGDQLLDQTAGLNVALTANSWNYLSEDQMLYLSTSEGVYSLKLSDYMSRWKDYRMQIDSAEADGEKVLPGEDGTYTIARSTKKLEIFPEIINFSTEDPFVQYRLEGFDTGWTKLRESELSSVVYTNLQPGSYRFILDVDDEDGTVLGETSYGFEKQKAVQDMLWFKLFEAIIISAVIIFLTWLFMKWRNRETQRRQEQELEITRQQAEMARQQAEMAKRRAEMADESVEIANQQAEMARQQMELAKQQVEVSNAAIMSIAKAVDAKDVRTSQHSSRVSRYSEMLARHLGFTDAECENIRKAALVHDIGKIGIPDAILNKPGKLTDEEYATMKTHVSKGAEILKDITFIDHVVDGALYHHERWDGKGYVHGLKGEEIPLYGRIIGVADAFDAMTANRVYRNHLDKDEVIAELKRCRGTQFDPEIDDIMLSMIESGEIDMDWLYQQIDQGK